MRTISIRQLQRGLYQELKDLPVVVTRRNQKIGEKRFVKDYLIIMPYRPDMVIDQSESDIELSKKPEQKKGLFGFLKK